MFIITESSFGRQVKTYKIMTSAAEPLILPSYFLCGLVDLWADLNGFRLETMPGFEKNKKTILT